jgi:hypothetical protein
MGRIWTNTLSDVHALQQVLSTQIVTKASKVCLYQENGEALAVCLCQENYEALADRWDLRTLM